MSKAKIQAGEAQCPNCSGTINVPKSTRSIICRHCEAIIKIVDVEDGLELKVVGRSVADDPTYQELESQIAVVKEHIADLHKEYEAEVAKPFSMSMFRIGIFGIFATLVGVVLLIFVPLVAAGLIGAGVLLTVLGLADHGRRKRARLEVLTAMSKQIEQAGAQRDRLQLKAARIKTQV
jgi:hypothetical protein